jgi:hypothetical protein
MQILMDIASRITYRGVQHILIKPVGQWYGWMGKAVVTYTEREQTLCNIR